MDNSNDKIQDTQNMFQIIKFETTNLEGGQ